MNMYEQSKPCRLSAMLLPLLLSACAASSPRQSSAPSVQDRVIPALSQSARQSKPSEPHLQRVRRNIEQWEQMLLSDTLPGSNVKASTTP